MVQASIVTKSEKPEEFGVRFGQYLVERGYLRIEDLPMLFRIMENWNEQPLMVILQRFVAEKLGVLKSGPMPASVAMLADLAHFFEQNPGMLRKFQESRSKPMKTERKI